MLIASRRGGVRERERASTRAPFWGTFSGAVGRARPRRPTLGSHELASQHPPFQMITGAQKYKLLSETLLTLR